LVITVKTVLTRAHLLWFPTLQYADFSRVMQLWM